MRCEILFTVGLLKPTGSAPAAVGWSLSGRQGRATELMLVIVVLKSYVRPVTTLSLRERADATGRVPTTKPKPRIAAMGNRRSPAARAAKALAQRRVEEQLRAAVRWLHGGERRTPAEALRTGLFPLITSAKALRKQWMKRSSEGTLYERSQQSLLKDEELDTLLGHYVLAGFTGGCDETALAFLRSGAIEMLKMRAKSSCCTELELRLLQSSATPIALGTCQMWAEMAKAVQKEVSWHNGSDLNSSV